MSATPSQIENMRQTIEADPLRYGPMVGPRGAKVFGVSSMTFNRVKRELGMGRMRGGKHKGPPKFEPGPVVRHATNLLAGWPRSPELAKHIEELRA